MNSLFSNVHMDVLHMRVRMLLLFFGHVTEKASFVIWSQPILEFIRANNQKQISE